nr:MAG TPA: putative head-tail adaptor [Caudoviricetes sp.]
MDAGRLNETIYMLGLKRDGDTWTWEREKKTWGNVREKSGRNIFSNIGLAAKSVSLILRQQPLTLYNAASWRGKHLFLTDIQQNEKLYLEVSAAVVAPVTCTAARTEDTVGEAGRPVTGEVMRLTFPGVLTEKYTRYEREADHGETDTGYVLVTPKPIALKTGDLVTIQDGQAPGVYHVTVCHVLDEFKNEYEIAHREDA